MIAKRAFLSVIAVLLASPLALAQTKVGIANPVRIFADLQETKDLKQKLDNDRRQLEATEKDKRQRLQDLQQRRDAVKPDAPQWAELNREFEGAVIEFQVWQQVSKVNFERVQKQQMRVIFDKIIDGVRHVATQKQLDLVVADQRPELPENLDQITLDQLRAIINQRNVLFSDAKTDISADVVNYLDAKYREGK
jgi:Skp family chaperone for outer membrane proteins